MHREANKAKSFQNTALIVSTIVYRGGLASRALCENKRAKIKFIDYAAEANDAISAVGIVEILEENLERMEFSQHRKSGSGGNWLEKIRPTSEKIEVRATDLRQTRKNRSREKLF